MSKDPVCGMEVDPRKAVGILKFEGKKYYFCSDRCKEEFKKNPRRYAY